MIVRAINAALFLFVAGMILGIDTLVAALVVVAAVIGVVIVVTVIWSMAGKGGGNS